MAVYRYRFCGSIYDEEEEGVSIPDLRVCPVCMVMAGKLMGAEDGIGGGKAPDGEKEKPVKKQETRETCKNCGGSIEEAEFYDPEYTRIQTDARYMDEIYEVAVKGQSIVIAVGTQVPMPGWDDVLFLGAQLNPMSLDEHAPVKIGTIIGKYTAKPIVPDHPVYTSHVFFGALSREIKTVLSRGNAMARTAMCSGEGDILPEEKAATHKYILEYVPNQCSMADENLREADAIEIKIGQGTKPGMGGRLPGSEVTPEIMAIRDKPLGQDIISPLRFPSIDTKEDSKGLVDKLRLISGGRPIGIKTTMGRIKKDLEFCVYVGLDFITIDGRGEVIGTSPKTIRDPTSVPAIYALYRTRKYLNQTGYGAQLVITGGPRVSSGFAKVLAIGANAVAIASAVLMAAVCQQYRICGIGMCPVGTATQDKKLCSRFKEDTAAQRVANLLRASLEEIKTFARVTGHDNTHDMDVDDSCIVSREISEFTSIRHV